MAEATTTTSDTTTAIDRLTADEIAKTVRDVSKTALVIVDVQNDFCEGGALAVPEGSTIIDSVNAMREKCTWSLVVLTQDWHPADHASFGSNNGPAPLFTLVELPEMGPQMMWPDHCVQNTEGAKFHHALVRNLETDLIVQKGKNPRVDSYSGFGDGKGHTLEKTQLEEELKAKGITDVFVCGLATDFCVCFTCKDAAKAGFNTYCVLGSSRGITPDTIAGALVDMKAVGVKLVDTAEDVIEGLSRARKEKEVVGEDGQQQTGAGSAE